MLAKGIRANRIAFPKTLLFCPTIAECSLIYKTLRNLLGEQFTDPPGYPDLHKHRLVDMYTRASSIEIKENFRIIYDRRWQAMTVGSYKCFQHGCGLPRYLQYYSPRSTVLLGPVCTRNRKRRTEWESICSCIVVWKTWKQFDFEAMYDRLLW